MNAPLHFKPQAKPHYQFFNGGEAAAAPAGKKTRVSFVLAGVEGMSEGARTQFGRVGDMLTLDLAPSDVHDPAELPTFLAGYKVEGLVADIVSPIIPTDAFSDKYRSFTDDNAFLSIDVKTGLQSKVPEVDPETKLDTFTVIERAVGSFIPDRLSSQARYNVRAAAMKRCSRALMLDREIDVSTLLLATASWASSSFYVTLGATTKWNGGSSSDPIADLHARIEASAQKVTAILFNRKVSNVFTRHAAVRDHLKSMLGSRGAEELLDQGESESYKLPGLPRIYVTDCKHKTVKGGALSYTWGDDVLLVTTPPGVPTDGEEIATCYTWRQNGPSGVGFITREFRIEERGSLGGTFVVAAMAEQAVMPGSNCGGLIKSVIQ